ncbi:uncharacterized protein FFNC_15417 [Fusarium fujikuroi]|nr:uncharacterized protein FFNC_15417 [Fusarium fujikuroi]
MYASAGKHVKAELFSDLVHDALEEYPYNAEPAGLHYNVDLGSHGLFLDVGGYTDKLPVLFERAATTISNLDIKEGRFEIVRERLIREYSNWHLEPPYDQIKRYTGGLNALAAELPNVTLQGVRHFQKHMLGQTFIEVYVHGNMHKKDALKTTHMVEFMLKPGVLPKAQRPILRSLVLIRDSDYVFRKGLKNSKNVNHCVDTWFYVSSREDRDIRVKTLLVGQILRQPVFDQRQSPSRQLMLDNLNHIHNRHRPQTNE